MNKYKRVVIKIGTSTLAHSNGKINFKRIEDIAKVVSDIRNQDVEVVLVSSGAVGIGMSKLGVMRKPKTVQEKQAAASIGQCELMNIYGKFFGEFGYKVAQILLTKGGIENEKRYNNAVNTFNKLLDWGVIPIVNENDTISIDELEFGDNDTLSATVSELVDADLLIIMSDIDGLYDKDPKTSSDAKIIERIEEITDEIIKNAGGVGSSLGTGGMITKITAAKRVMQDGIDMIIINGNNPNILYDAVAGKSVGSLFVGRR